MAVASSAGETGVVVDGCRTVPQLFRQRATTLAAKTALREKALGIWHDISWTEYFEQARSYGCALIELGFQRGDVLAIAADPRKEWLYFDMAAQCCGGIANGIYSTDSAAQMRYIFQDSDARFLVVENEEQLDKWLEVRADLPNLIKVIVLEDKGLKELDDPDVMFLEDFVGLGRSHLEANAEEWERRIDATRPEDTALLVYTSGTTGPPKGAMISQHNVLWQARSFAGHYGINGSDECVSYLPLCHIVERSLSVFLPLYAGSTVNFIEAPGTAFDNITEVSPTYFLGVPRIWEKMYSSIVLRMKDATFIGKAAFGWALRIGERVTELKDRGEPLPPGLRLARWLAGRLVHNNIKVMLGLDRARVCITGAAPISPDLIGWFRALGVPLFEAYGQTESAGGITANRAGADRVGTIGRPVEGVEIRIAEDGEILARGEFVFQGYLNQPEKTAETVIDGWLYTGDVGSMDADGFVTITDRKKDIIITAGGKNITPSEIENQIKASPYVSDAVIIGDRRKYLTTLIMIDHDNVAQFAQDMNVPFSDFRSLCRAEEVRALISAEVEKVNVRFARVETVKKFRLIEQQLTAEDDELTATMKLKRSFVEIKYKDLIDDMYADA